MDTTDINGDQPVTTARTARLERETTETRLWVRINLDGSGQHHIGTGVGFLDHMLEQVSRHALVDLEVKADGDLHIDPHHTTEDTGIAIGQAIATALGDKRGIRRYGQAVIPMDEALVRVAIDLSGRPFLVWHVTFHGPMIGTMDTQLVREWFQAFAVHAAATVHVECFYGVNDHHIAEGCFKALAQALRAAIEPDPRRGDAIPSTKGRL